MDREGMVEIPAGRFRMGSDDFYAEEGAVRDAEVDALAIDRGPVTVTQFTRFVQETGYVTVAERDEHTAATPGFARVRTRRACPVPSAVHQPDFGGRQGATSQTRRPRARSARR
jgi:formylglycine-generating enzyme required for sulfatase activity